MDSADRILFIVGLTALAVGLTLVSQAVRTLQEDLALLRMTAAVPDIERHT